MLLIDIVWGDSDRLWGSQGQQLSLLWLYYLLFPQSPQFSPRYLEII